MTPNMPKQNMNTTKLYLRLDTMGFCRWHSLLVHVLRGCSLHKLTWKCCPWGSLQESLIVRGSLWWRTGETFTPYYTPRFRSAAFYLSTSGSPWCCFWFLSCPRSGEAVSCFFIFLVLRWCCSIGQLQQGVQAAVSPSQVTSWQCSLYKAAKIKGNTTTFLVSLKESLPVLVLGKAWTHEEGTIR